MDVGRVLVIILGVAHDGALRQLCADKCLSYIHPPTNKSSVNFECNLNTHSRQAFRKNIPQSHVPAQKLWSNSGPLVQPDALPSPPPRPPSPQLYLSAAQPSCVVLQRGCLAGPLIEPDAPPPPLLRFHAQKLKFDPPLHFRAQKLQSNPPPRIHPTLT